MAQFGVGPDFAAQCPRVPTPDGWRNWTDADGPIPDALAKRAAAVAADLTITLGATESYPLPGVTALIRVEPHTWGRDSTGALVQGCFRAGSVFLPTGAAPVPDITAPSLADKAVRVLTITSLVIGIGSAVAAWWKS